MKNGFCMKKYGRVRFCLAISLLLVFSPAYATQYASEMVDAQMCYLEDGYHLPKHMEFADGCQETDLPSNKILWLVKNDNPLDKKYGFVNSHGEVVIPLQYQRANTFHEGLAVVDLDYDKSGYIDTTGKLAIPAEYEFASDFHDGWASVKKNGKIGFIDKHNQVKLPFIYANADNFENGFASATMTGKDEEWGVIDKTGKIVVPFKYRYVYQVSPNEAGWVFSVTQDDKEMMLNEKGNIVFPAYDEIGFIEQGLVNVKKGEKWGFVNAKNETKIDFVYDEAIGFYNGLALVKKDGKYGFINPLGEVVIPLIYDKISQPFYDSFGQNVDTITAQKDGKFYFLHKDGSTMPLNFDEVDDYMKGVFQDLVVVANRDKTDPNKRYYGVINKHGKIVIALKYSFIHFNATGLYQNLPIVVTSDGHWYVIDFKGEIIADKTKEYNLMKYY